MFNISKCKDKAVYSAKLQNSDRLNLEKIAQAFNTLEKTPILLLIEMDGCEIIVHKHGELMFKDCTDLAKINKMAEEIYKAGLS